MSIESSGSTVSQCSTTRSRSVSRTGVPASVHQREILASHLLGRPWPLRDRVGVEGWARQRIKAHGCDGVNAEGAAGRPVSGLALRGGGILCWHKPIGLGVVSAQSCRTGTTCELAGLDESFFGRGETRWMLNRIHTNMRAVSAYPRSTRRADRHGGCGLTMFGAVETVHDFLPSQGRLFDIVISGSACLQSPVDVCGAFMKRSCAFVSRLMRVLRLSWTKPLGIGPRLVPAPRVDGIGADTRHRPTVRPAVPERCAGVHRDLRLPAHCPRWTCLAVDSHRRGRWPRSVR